MSLYNAAKFERDRKEQEKLLNQYQTFQRKK